jgi:hypothetical protein
MPARKRIRLRGGIMTQKKQRSADEIIEAMVNNLKDDSLKKLFHKNAGVGPCTFCGKFGHSEDNCPEVQKKKSNDDDSKATEAAKKNALKNLTALADTLDKQGFTELANAVDESIEKIAKE